MSDSLLIVERASEIATVTLNRPEKRNALNAELRLQIAHAFTELDQDDAVKVVVITGAGNVFCAGFDLKEFAQSDATAHFTNAEKNPLQFHEVIGAFTKPIVGAINSAALAGGFDLAAQCDVRIASDAATFGHPEIKFAPVLYTQLASIVGGAVARDLVLSGRRIDAAEALRIGLVSKVVAPEALMDETYAYARTVAEAPLEVLRVMKRTINERAPFTVF
jgi:enoyl-CoA hydratase